MDCWAVKSHGFGLIDTDSKASKQASDLVKFEYVCAGYSQFMSKNEVSIDNEGTKPALPVCTGLKVTLFHWNFYLRSPCIE